jgi:hypothetical protein
MRREAQEASTAETEPTTPRGRRLQVAMSSERWRHEVPRAHSRALTVEAVLRERQPGESLRACQERVAPEVCWSTWVNWYRRYGAGIGPAWECLLDGRVPPVPPPIPEAVRVAARTLRRGDRSITPEKARQHLVAEFGEAGAISDTSLKRIWAEAGLSYERPVDDERAVPGEEVLYFSGGAGLALLSAADAALGLSQALGKAALEAGRLTAAQQVQVEAPQRGLEERNERGQFTASYNAAWREGVEAGRADERWAPEAHKRATRPLGELATLQQSPERLGMKLLCMGVTPLLTERRGFEGLVALPGQWLELLGGPAYMPATLAKSLAELALLDVGAALWDAHAGQWFEVSRRWSENGPAWLRLVAYIDATQDPYWTRHYALSGKVSRVGRVMPCLTRVALASGPGVPLLVETHPGTAPLKRHVLSLLRRADRQIGPGEVGRLTILDAEAASAELFMELAAEQRLFITVLKGGPFKAVTVESQGAWVSYRERDQVRELTLRMGGKGAPAGGLALRGVEMTRSDGRRPKSTIFATNAPLEEFETAHVPAAYLSRWPHQEQLFRDARNGGGLQRSHGYGGDHVTHVALATRLERAHAGVTRAEKNLLRAESVELDIAEAAAANDDPAVSIHRDTLAVAVKQARQAKRALEKAQANVERLETMPREIYRRDTHRDNIATCLKLTALMLIEYVLKEYFGGLKMEWRRFLEETIPLPVTCRTSKERLLYQIHANVRQPQRTDQLRQACEVINSRRLRRDGRALRFEVIDPVGRGP